MSDVEKLQAWIDYLGEQGNQSVSRWLDSVEKLSSGSYKPEDALSDWYFYMSRGLALLPAAPGSDENTLPVIPLQVHANQTDAAAVKVLPRRAPDGTAVMDGGLVKAGDDTVTIPKRKLTVELLDGGTQLLVKIDLKDVELNRADCYTGSVSVKGTTIADVELKVLGRLP